jgi:hypothetical protein
MEAYWKNFSGYHKNIPKKKEEEEGKEGKGERK